MYRLFLERFEIPVRMGVHAFEREGPQRLLVDVELFVTRLGPGDTIESVADYDYLRETILAIAREGHFDLQETFCEAILARISDRPEVAAATVTSRKPDVYPDCASVGCTMGQARDGFDPRWLMLRIS